MADIYDKLEAARKRAVDQAEKIKLLEERAASKTIKAISSLTKSDRAEDTRRKILAGAAVLEMIKTDYALSRALGEKLDQIIRTADRALFADLLPSKATATATAVQAPTPAPVEPVKAYSSSFIDDLPRSAKPE